jgi:hypothetical protein
VNRILLEMTSDDKIGGFIVQILFRFFGGNDLTFINGSINVYQL